MTAVALRSVLYAEDDENDVFFMERAFSKLKLRSTLHVVPNGRAVVNYLSGTGIYSDRAKFPLPDILILDVKMPDMSGLEVLKWARERAELWMLPIVLFTSSTQRADIEFSRLHRASAYLVKPSNSEHLSGLVNRLLHACLQWTPDGAGPLAVEGNQISPGID